MMQLCRTHTCLNTSWLVCTIQSLRLLLLQSSCPTTAHSSFHQSSCIRQRSSSKYFGEQQSLLTWIQAPPMDFVTSRQILLLYLAVLLVSLPLSQCLWFPLPLTWKTRKMKTKLSIFFTQWRARGQGSRPTKNNRVSRSWSKLIFHAHLAQESVAPSPASCSTSSSKR